MLSGKAHLVVRPAFIDCSYTFILAFFDWEVDLAENYYSAARNIVYLEGFPNSNL
jgi:hypothetical protein